MITDEAEKIPTVTIRDVIEQGLTARPEGMSVEDWDYSGVAAHDLIEFEDPTPEERAALLAIAEDINLFLSAMMDPTA